MAASGKDTPCSSRFDSALAESHSKSPSTTVGIAYSSRVYAPYQVNSVRPANALALIRGPRARRVQRNSSDLTPENWTTSNASPSIGGLMKKSRYKEEQIIAVVAIMW